MYVWVCLYIAYIYIFLYIHIYICGIYTYICLPVYAPFVMANRLWGPAWRDRWGAARWIWIGTLWRQLCQKAPKGWFSYCDMADASFPAAGGGQLRCETNCFLISIPIQRAADWLHLSRLFVLPYWFKWLTHWLTDSLTDWLTVCPIVSSWLLVAGRYKLKYVNWFL